MIINIMNDDIICALATAATTSAIGVVRISGKGCFEKVCPLLVRNNKTFDYQQIISHKAYYCHIADEGSFLDEVLVTFFKAPHSYTGEDSVEISCHGSTYIEQRLIEILINSGIRMACPGEFTMRAFRNGKLDLAQAEAVADMIASRSKAAHDIAANQLRGTYSSKINTLRQQLVDFTALIELELDFSDEDVEFADRTKFFELINNLKVEINTLLRSFKAGNAIKNGIPVAIVGRPNVGKSTLLNALVNDEKAIVSDIPGTTRDSIEDEFVIDGYTFRFIDTAGIRSNTDDTIERLGIERTYAKMQQATIVIYVTEAATFSKHELEPFADIIANTDKTFIVVANKIDLASAPTLKVEGVRTVMLSAKSRTNLDELNDALVEIVKNLTDQQDTVIVSNLRHVEALQRALGAIESVERGFSEGLPTDLATIDLHIALDALGEITGNAITSNEILGTIFGKFCIGK